MTKRTNAPTRGESNITPSGPLQWVLGGVFVAIGVAGFGVSLGYNWKFGFALLGLYGGLGFALADVIKFAMPFTAKVTGGWRAGYVATYALMLVVSLSCVGLHILNDLDAAWRAGERAGSKLASATADEAAARKRLDAITETSTVEALASLLTSANAKVAGAEEIAAKLGIKCAERKACRAEVEKRDAIIARKGEAETRDQLTKALGAAQDKGEAVKVEPVAGAGGLARLTGISEETAASGISGAALVFFVAVLEMTAILAGWGGGLLRDAWERRPSKLAPRPQEAPQAPQEGAGEAGDVSPADRKAETLLRLQMRIHASPGRAYVISKAKLAAEWNIAPSTLSDWCKDWRASGEIGDDRQGNETRFTVPALRVVNG